MKFAFLLYETAADFAARTDGNRSTYWGAWGAYTSSLIAAGVVEPQKMGVPLELPDTGVTVHRESDGRHVQDGPFADTKEQIGGVIILEAATLDEALAWAARCPCASSGAVEVRPIWEMS